jgi:hypothetical protein
MSASDSIDCSGIRAQAELHCVRTLGAIVEHAQSADVVRKTDVGWGDRVIVWTRNSLYCLHALGDGLFAVSGGWFERNPEQKTVTVNGCTYGGRAILAEVVAARGLFLEFGNNVSTTRIRDVRVLKHEEGGEVGPVALPC